MKATVGVMNVRHAECDHPVLQERQADGGVATARWLDCTICELARLRAESERINHFPWNKREFHGWAIVGMNHYHVDGDRRLFVAMTRGGKCIVAEGRDEPTVFELLRQKASEQ